MRGTNSNHHTGLSPGLEMRSEAAFPGSRQVKELLSRVLLNISEPGGHKEVDPSFSILAKLLLLSTGTW